MTHPDKLRDRLHALPMPPTLVPPADLADGVVASARRRSRNGWIGATAAAVVAAGVATPYLLQAGGPGPGGQLDVAASPVVPTTSSPANAGKLVPGPAPSLGTFPFTPGKAHAYRLGRQGAGTKLTSSSNNRHIPSGPDVYVVSDPKLPTDGQATGSTTTTVRGMSATVTRMKDKVKVTWQEKPGQWVVVESGVVPEADVVRYAQELRPDPQPIPMPLDFAWLPAGMKVAATSDGAVDESVAFASEKGGDSGPIIVSRTGNDVGKVGDPVSVGDRTGLVSHQNGVTILWVPLPGHGNLSIDVPDALGFTQADLVQFAQGISNP
ncbi:hypothetical protein JOF56_005260 [Kibdelosporangium banguiense]|uniref:Uncharacterized protein n=1 Tax=Kibdelosporangium banguiense TaxID=1365924 RepID=A0ABS4TLN0_9PSEU|nr:hypothetical protein [Kibdelosporangium banguiense]MBP2324875.1 hypothetical protein [Kibdelosporangium banguiense]